MYNGLLHAHSGLRWVFLALLLFAIFNAFSRKGLYEKKDRLLYLFTMIFAHVQLTIGLVLYFQSPKVQFVEGMMKVAQYRFFGVEHFLGMLIAVVLITLGRKKSEQALTNVEKHRKIKVFYTLGLLVILAFIPWPFREVLGGAWF